MKNKYCKDCNKLISSRAIRCRSCSVKFQYKTGKINPKYKDGRTKKIYYCVECKKNIITKESALYKTGLCLPCARKETRNANYKHGVYIGIKYCECGKVISNKSSYCSSCAKLGRRNPAYYHGNGYLPYPNEWTKKFTKYIRKRYNYTCQLCSKIHNKNKRKFEVHHIDYNKNNLDLDNLTLLCHKCHCKTNYNREYWKNYFKNEIKTIKL